MGLLNQKPALSPLVKRLMFVFAFVYFSQGVAQVGGLISQPLDFYLKEALGFNAQQAAAALLVLVIPWTIKPLYGLISDFVPIFGYRRKSWLVLANGAAVGSFLWLTGLTQLEHIQLALIVTAVGIAASDVIIDALMIENGERLNAKAKFQAVQWLWFYVAFVVTSIVGGFLCQYLEPASALHTAALITACAPAAVLFVVWFMVKEERVGFNRAQLWATVGGVKQALTNPTLWAVVVFLAFWNFSPSVGQPMYYHMVDTLGFSQKFIGYLAAITGTGSALGAWLYGRYFEKKTLKFQLTFSIIAGSIGMLSYMLVSWPHALVEELFIGLDFITGATSMIATLTTLTLAAQVCPKNAEGVTFSGLMSVTNGFAKLAGLFGAWLYVSIFAESLMPLIGVSAVFTLACFLLVPILNGVKYTPSNLAEKK